MGIAATVWLPKDGNGEYANISAVDIVDPSGNFIVDPSGNNLISTDVQFTPVSSTTWTGNEAA